jgi:hypothetical protein
MEATCSSEMPVEFQRITRRYVPEGRALHDVNGPASLGSGDVTRSPLAPSPACGQTSVGKDVAYI